MRNRILVPVALTAVVALLLLCGCSGSASARVEGGNGTLTLHLTDAPLNLADVLGVNVTLTGVLVYPGEEVGSGITDPAGTGLRPVMILNHPTTFDLLTLTGGATALLASGEVPDGSYERIRLEISGATLVYKDGTTAALKIDSDKVDIPIPFHVTGGGQTDIILDFDAGASVQVNQTGNGKLILRPVVTPVSVTP